MSAQTLPEKAAESLMAVFDAAVDQQWRRAQGRVESERRRHPDATAQEVAASVVRDFRRDLTVIGGLSGALAAVPGPGTAVRLVGGLSAEGLMLLERSVLMALAVAAAYGHDLADVEIRKYALLRVLGAWAGAAEGMASFSSVVAAGLGTKATKAVPMSAVHAINRAVGKRVVVKWATKSGTLRLGSALPFGIGAGLGAGGNHLMARGLGKVAIAEFR
ncbi:hypothetical protein [uncultured Pseudokineococcus sp.]|uniref:hypothetical protein n=1 Tax=uncultured Pseudokineococcus sp. TaxID=1642928 RepID=UPI002607D3BF|nr:hypothetical protein [uncultured Pseudokineococcus sp.]